MCIKLLILLIFPPKGEKNFHFFFQLEDNNTKWKLSVWGRNSEETRCPQPIDFSVSKRNNRGIPSLNTTVIPQHPEQQKDLRKRNQGWNIRASSRTSMRRLTPQQRLRPFAGVPPQIAPLTEFYMPRSLDCDPREVLKTLHKWQTRGYVPDRQPLLGSKGDSWHSHTSFRAVDRQRTKASEGLSATHPRTLSVSERNQSGGDVRPARNFPKLQHRCLQGALHGTVFTSLLAPQSTRNPASPNVLKLHLRHKLSFVPMPVCNRSLREQKLLSWQ